MKNFILSISVLFSLSCTSMITDSFAAQNDEIKKIKVKKETVEAPFNPGANCNFVCPPGMQGMFSGGTCVCSKIPI